VVNVSTFVKGADYQNGKEIEFLYNCIIKTGMTLITNELIGSYCVLIVMR
jgi:hypothetical protein